MEIKFVPLVILFLDGRPTFSYSGDIDQRQIVSWIMAHIDKLNRNRAFIRNQKQGQPTQEQPSEHEIPDYSLGKPVMGFGRDMEGVTYLHWKDFNDVK